MMLKRLRKAVYSRS